MLNKFRRFNDHRVFSGIYRGLSKYFEEPKKINVK